MATFVFISTYEVFTFDKRSHTISETTKIFHQSWRHELKMKEASEQQRLSINDIQEHLVSKNISNNMVELLLRALPWPTHQKKKL